jgi:hypothetical protein
VHVMELVEDVKTRLAILRDNGWDDKIGLKMQ